MSNSIRKQLTKKREKVSIPKDELSPFYFVQVTSGDDDYELDLTNIIAYNLSGFAEIEMEEIQIQMEGLSAIRISIIQSIKTLKSRLTAVKVEHRVWLGEANQLGARKYYDWLAIQRKDDMIKTLLRPPTKEDIVDYFLNDPVYRKVYAKHQEEIGHLTDRIKFLDTVDDVLKARTMALQSILKQNPPGKYDSSL